MTNYEIIKVSPQQLHLQVRYTKEECPDYWVNLRVTDFTDEGIHQSAQDGAPQAEQFWSTISELPAEVTPTEMSGVAKDRVSTPCPDYNPMTQNVAWEWVETNDAITETWTVTEKTDEEKTEVLAESRKQVVVTMRQARLALLQQGLLSSVAAAIAGLPEGEKEAAEIQWEYGSDVERLSPLVVGLMPALGMSEEEIDALFVLAGTL
jgi:hypothetical protein